MPTRLTDDATGRALLRVYATRPGDRALIAALVDLHIDLGYSEADVSMFHWWANGMASCWRIDCPPMTRRARQRALRGFRKRLTEDFGDFTSDP